MRAVDNGHLKEGMRVARTVFDESGRVLLKEGVVLNYRYINRLKEIGIPFIYIEDELLGHIEVEDVIDERVKLQTVEVLKNVTKNASLHQDLDIRPVSNMVNKILDDLKGTPNLLVQLMDLRSAGTYLYNHSVGVSVLSILTGMTLGFDDLKLKVLGMGAILHDIGKSISKGPDHTTQGFEILRNDKSLSIIAAHVAYQHHERYDGTGFPRQLSGKEIHLYASITSVADFYDNLVSVKDKNKQQRLFPYQAIEKVVALQEKAFHPEVVKAFCRNIAPYPIGTAVRLNNGVIGVVLSVPKDYSTRPIIKMITDKNGVLQKDFPEIDLLEEKDLKICEIISEEERQRTVSKI
ncbi:MAG: HD-GYP domain-containing protein [Peptococcia bacterium]|jgi:putative nucleotidyltransferase with HDIG domain